METEESWAAKPFLSYNAQVALLCERGMIIDDTAWAVERLRATNYYRLSGYWYSFRKPNGPLSRDDEFLPGTNLRDVIALYDFDAQLRRSVFEALAPIELSFRALIGHELGRIDKFIHLKPELLGPRGYSQATGTASDEYQRWLKRYRKEKSRSREDFIKHHDEKYNGALPIWVAVEITDWGNLSYLYAMAPEGARKAIANKVELTPPQLDSWMRTLNNLRNDAAHHTRMFNKVYGTKPRLPRDESHELYNFSAEMNRFFGQASLIQYLTAKLQLPDTTIPATLATFPSISVVPISHMGVPQEWESHYLWQLNPKRDHVIDECLPYEPDDSV